MLMRAPQYWFSFKNCCESRNGAFVTKAPENFDERTARIRSVRAEACSQYIEQCGYGFAALGSRDGLSGGDYDFLEVAFECTCQGFLRLFIRKEAESADRLDASREVRTAQRVHEGGQDGGILELARQPDADLRALIVAAFARSDQCWQRRLSEGEHERVKGCRLFWILLLTNSIKQGGNGV